MAHSTGQLSRPLCKLERAWECLPLQMGGTVFDMEEAELCYAPQVSL